MIAVPSRRRFLFAAGALLMAPSIVRASSLMPISTRATTPVGVWVRHGDQNVIAYRVQFTPMFDVHPGAGLGDYGVIVGLQGVFLTPSVSPPSQL